MNLTVEIEQVVVTDLSDLVDTCLLRHVFWRGWLWKEIIALGLDVVFLGRRSSLLSQEVGQVDFDAGRRARAQIVGLGLRLALLEFEQLLFDHLDLLFLALLLDTLLLFLGWSQVGLQ